jgi:hypothetical protein
VQWDEIELANGARTHLVKLPEPSADARLEALNALIRKESGFPEFFRALSGY